MRTRIRELRRERKMSQAELAEAVGTTRQTITSIEVEKYTASLPLAYKRLSSPCALTSISACVASVSRSASS